MRADKRFYDLSMSRGERSRLFAYVVVALCGAIVGYAVVLRLSLGFSVINGLSGYDIWMIVTAAIGSMAGLYLAGDRFGQPGWAGLRRAMLATIWVSFVGSVIGGSLMLPFYGTMFGPFTLLVTLASSPLLALLWVLNLMGAHSLLNHWRRERDTIFTAFEDGRIESYRSR